MNAFRKKVLMGSAARAFLMACLCAAAPQMTFAAENEVVAAKSSDSLKIVPTLGYTYFNVTGSSVDFKSKGGNSVGVLVQKPMTHALEIESGLEYLETGAKQSQDDGLISFDALNVTIKNIAIPVRAKYTFNPETNSAHWYGKAGLTPTYVVAAKADVSGESSSDIKSNLNAFGVLTQAGLGVDWGVESIMGRLSLDLTYSYGLTKVFKDNGGRATGYQLQAGYAFSL